VVQVSHLPRHLSVRSLTVVRLMLLRLRLTLRVLGGLRCLQMASELLGTEPKETCVLIVYIRSTV
jgi:hypothetical protein